MHDTGIYKGVQMTIWVKDNETGAKWILDNDATKPVYNDADGQMVFDIADIGRFRFYPMDPDSPEVKRYEQRLLDENDDGYQFNIFDFM